LNRFNFRTEARPDYPFAIRFADHIHQGFDSKVRSGDRFRFAEFFDRDKPAQNLLKTQQFCQDVIDRDLFTFQFDDRLPDDLVVYLPLFV
jgi:hypothetical protein